MLMAEISNHNLRDYAEELGVDVAEHDEWVAWHISHNVPPEHNVDWLLRTAARRHIIAGRWAGRFALEMWGQIHDNRPTYYHGSYKPPEVIGERLEPRQMVWTRDGIGHADGSPAVALDVNIDVPIIRALIHDDAPSFAGGEPPLLHRRTNAFGQQHWLTNESTLARVGTGYVYSTTELPHLDQYRDAVLGLRPEVRYYESFAYDVCVPVTAGDLPGSLVVIDADSETAKAISELVPEGSMQEIARASGVGIRTLGGELPLLPLEAYPGIQAGR